MAQDSMFAATNSLSRRYGRGAFPLHTDGAHRLNPPQFIILTCVEPGVCAVPTMLVRMSDMKLTAVERQIAETEAFLFLNGRRSFYSTILNR